MEPQTFPPNSPDATPRGLVSKEGLKDQADDSVSTDENDSMTTDPFEIAHRAFFGN